MSAPVSPWPSPSLQLWSVMAALAICYAVSVQPRVPLAAAQLTVAGAAVKRNRSAVGVAVGGLATQILWICLWASAVLGGQPMASLPSRPFTSCPLVLVNSFIEHTHTYIPLSDACISSPGFSHAQFSNSFFFSEFILLLRVDFFFSSHCCPHLLKGSLFVTSGCGKSP